MIVGVAGAVDGNMVISVKVCSLYGLDHNFSPNLVCRCDLILLCQSRYVYMNSKSIRDY